MPYPCDPIAGPSFERRLDSIRRTLEKSIARLEKTCDQALEKLEEYKILEAA